jgi:hypothetical protein
MLKPSTVSLRKAAKSPVERLELKMTGWLAVRAEGKGGIRAAVFLVSWLTALALVYLALEIAANGPLRSAKFLGV